MEEDWKDCANNDIEMRKVISKAKISRYVSNAIITLHTVAVLFYGISIILTNVDITDRTIEIPHIMRMEFPFNIKTQSTYKFVLIMELIQLIMSSWGMGMINALLITLSKVIGYAAYDSAWYDMEPKDRRILLLIILRSQKQLTLTIGKLMDLSLQRFTSVSMTRAQRMNSSFYLRTIHLSGYTFFMFIFKYLYKIFNLLNGFMHVAFCQQYF
ncbi:hypothetical protein EAI_05251 [Harpegnathos saltator]|uniref:Uncharacterized protein n=1 Tax=Harpegnathos saltator TaxID=610380 RepID=E2C9T4_HARSA|nr:hypothetical protein EAI_05251 [Harpegnathos saltator]